MARSGFGDPPATLKAPGRHAPLIDPEPLRYAHIDTPVGPLWLAASERGLAAVHFDEPETQLLAGWRKRFGREARWDEGAVKPYAAELEGYFAGAVTRFREPLDVLAGTPFQRRVWDRLRAIPYGETRSYRWLAEQAGAGKGFRAVGAANQANPLPVVVPCHRVVHADGSLGGYAGRPEVKRVLLRLEGALPA